MLLRIFKTLLVVLLALGLVFTPGLISSAEAGLPVDYVPGQVIVRLAPLLGVTIDLINSQYGTTTLGELYGHTDIYLLGTPPGISAPDLVSLLDLDPSILWVELNYLTDSPEGGSTDRIYAFGGPDASSYGSQEAVKALRLEEAHRYSRGAGTQVAVLDTGVQGAHPELAASLHPLGYDFVDGDSSPEEAQDGSDNDGDGRVDEGYGHGTHVAGIVHLVAPEAEILSLRVLDTDGRGNDFRTANAILYAAYNGAEVINLSLGTPYPANVLRQAVREAAGQGALVVAAAGNLNSQAKQYPAAEACAVAITSLDDKDRKSSFANYGSWIGLAAPGENIYSPFPVDSYAWWSGTSMATPITAGGAALLFGLNPALTPHKIGELLGGTAQSLAAKNPDYLNLLGAGKIDPLASLQVLASGGRPPVNRGLLSGCSP